MCVGKLDFVKVKILLKHIPPSIVLLKDDTILTGQSVLQPESGQCEKFQQATVWVVVNVFGPESRNNLQ